jgi:NAD(P)-dependent dehydrogenase (short-subunit alcohol dehydrogenase family)
MVSVNYFGAIATLEGLRPLLARSDRASAVAISSNSTTTQPGLSAAIVDACLAGDEEAARAAAAPAALLAYGATKLALARWVRRNAVTADWIGQGIRLNAVAPGFVDTPMTAGGWDYVAALGDIYPIPIGRPGKPEEVAGLLAYLLSPDAGFFCGSVVFMDGGTDAAVRPDAWPTAVNSRAST